MSSHYVHVADTGIIFHEDVGWRFNAILSVTASGLLKAFYERDHITTACTFILFLSHVQDAMTFALIDIYLSYVELWLENLYKKSHIPFTEKLQSSRAEISVCKSVIGKAW